MPGYMSKNICLAVEVFEGNGQDLVLMQEFPGVDGEHYVRIFVDMDNVEKLCAEIMSVARRARSK